MTPARRARRVLSRLGLNRSMLVRRLTKLGHPRLRELRAGALAGRDPVGVALWPLVCWIERGLVMVPQGRAGGLCFDMRYLPISHAHLGAIAFGNLEVSVQEAMIRHLGKGGVLYDIGANVGFFALLGGHLAGFQEGHVYAFEAAPDNAAAIRHNASINRVPNVTVINKAVSDAAGVGRLQVVDDQSWSKLEEYGRHPYTEEVLDVELIAIDDLVQAAEIRPPTLVKIDVEGAEIAVIEGMARTLQTHRPAVICELHGTHREFVAAMAHHGYRIVNLEGTIPVATEGASAHALALPALHPGD